MDILSYTKKIKEFKESEILSTLNNVQVAAQDLLGNIDSLRANDINLDGVAERWVVSRGVQKHLANVGFRNSLLESVQFGLKALVALTPEVTKLVKGYNQKIWDGQLMTLRQTNLLNLGEYMTFWVKYTTVMLDVLLTMHNEGSAPEKLLNKHDTRWISGTEDLYRSFSVDLMKGARAIIQNVERIPDIEVSESSLDVLSATEGSVKVDALQKGFAIHLINPVYWVSLGYSKIQLWRIERMRRSNELFAMKISQAINKRNGANDPHLDRQIEIYQNEIAKNDHKISEIEADYA